MDRRPTPRSMGWPEAKPTSKVDENSKKTPGWIRPVIVIFSIIFGFAAGIFLPLGLHLVGINIPASMAETLSQYRTYTGVEVSVFTVFFGWLMYQVIAGRFLERKVRDGSSIERLASSVRHPSVVGLAIAWVVALATVIGYPVAIYMTWRFYAERREAESKACPRCAERIKAAALVCRHCGHAFEQASAQGQATTGGVAGTA